MTKHFVSRKFLSVFVLVFMAFLLVACGTPTETPVEVTPTPVEETPTPVEPIPTPVTPTTDPTRIYFYNSDGWSNVSAYTFGPEFFGGWPGALATQDGDSDWFYMDVPQDPTVTPINIIFNNGGAGSQTGDIVINSLTLVYITVRNEVFASKALAEASFGDPVVTTRVFFLNSNNWSEVNAYTYSPEVFGGWPGVAAVRDGESDWFYVDVPLDPTVTPINIIFNGGGSQTSDILINSTANVYVTVSSELFASKALAEDSLPKNIVLTAINADDFEVLVAAVLAAQLDGALSGEGPFTVFAPTDAAFIALLAELDLTAEQLLANPDLADILLFHVIPGNFYAADVMNAAPFFVETLSGAYLYIEVVDGDVLVNGSKVILPDVVASNGIIHVIDKVIMPPANLVGVALAADDFEVLAAALTKANLVGALATGGPFTVFAPTDAAFTALLTELGISAEDLLNDGALADILLYHVIEGSFLAADVIAAAPFYVETLNGSLLYVEVSEGKVYVNGTEVIMADVQASNGVIHVIDAVLVPYSNLGNELIDNGFDTLVLALATANLLNAVNDAEAFTIFAPTDEAFAALLVELDMTAEQLLALPNLSEILLFHVIEGEFLASDVIEAAPFYVETLSGEFLYIQVVDGNVLVNGATVVLPNILATNGVIHGINAVILPPSDLISTALAAGGFETLFAALIEAELAETLTIGGPFTVFAPNDQAFADLLAALGITAAELLADEALADILLFHVIEGEFLAADVIAAAPFFVETLNGELLYVQVVEGKVYVSGAEVILADVVASNGVIHVIDSVLLPPGNIVELALAAEGFDILVAALLEAELDGALAGEGPFTVFAPTDFAFTALLTELDMTAEQLLALPNLADILLFHVVSGQLLAEDVIAGAPFYVETLNGDFLYVEVVEGDVLVNGATVIIPNVLASNGVIHVIDAVLLPQTLLYSTAFESAEDFTAGTIYNNQTVVYRGPAEAQWGFYYGTPSTTGAISGAQSAQMRFYTSVPANLGYIYTNFDVEDVSKIVFKASGTNGINVTVSVSSDGGTTFGNEETFVLTSSAQEFVYTVGESLQTGNLRVKFQITFEATPSNASRLYIDDVRLFG